MPSSNILMLGDLLAKVIVDIYGVISYCIACHFSNQLVGEVVMHDRHLADPARSAVGLAWLALGAARSRNLGRSII
jgi:hypothetical protein